MRAGDYSTCRQCRRRDRNRPNARENARAVFIGFVVLRFFPPRKQYSIPVPGACAQLPHKYLKCPCVPITRNYRFLRQVAVLIPSNAWWEVRSSPGQDIIQGQIAKFP